MNDDPCWWSIGQIASSYRTGLLTPERLVRHLLARIDRLDPLLNCFLSIDPALAIFEANRATKDISDGHDKGPLHGVPVGIKDVIDVRGFITTCHSRLMPNVKARHDAEAVSKLRSSGAIILGKLATHEFAIGGPTFDLPYAPARNPWGREYHPGGSSSGAGAAVAAGLIPAALGTDTAGSIRNPASCCGIVGLKPTYDLVSRHGVFPLAPSLDHVGPLTRDVEDAGLILAAISGRPFDLHEKINALKVGFVRHFHEEDMQATSEMRQGLETVGGRLRQLGLNVFDVRLPPLNQFSSVCKTFLQAEGFAVHQQRFQSAPEAFSALTRAALLPGAFLTEEDLVTADLYRSSLSAAVEAAFQKVDILMTASSMEPACRIDDPAEIKRTYMQQARTVFNVTGHPAITLMTGLSEAGLPLSVQFAARKHDEITLLSFAKACQAAIGDKLHPNLD